MYAITLELYTTAEIHAAAVPFIVDGKLNPAIPKHAGIYVFPGRSKIFYVGKTTRSLYHRLQVYQREPIFRLIGWHLLEPTWVNTYEMVYIKKLQPTLNEMYHVSPLNPIRYRGRIVKEKDLTWAERIEAQKVMQVETDKFFLRH